MTDHDRLMKEYHTYTCKVITIMEETGEKIRPLGFGEWLDQRNEPKRPNEFDNGR